MTQSCCFVLDQGICFTTDLDLVVFFVLLILPLINFVLLLCSRSEELATGKAPLWPTEEADLGGDGDGVLRVESSSQLVSHLLYFTTPD